jgi:hypothetical protein
MRTMKIKPVMVVIPITVGALVATGMTSIMAKTEAVLLLGKMS